MNPAIRLLRINRRLTAQERAILCVRASHRGEPEGSESSCPVATSRSSAGTWRSPTRL